MCHKDVIHGLSLQQGAGSFLVVIVPGTPTRIMLTPTQPGEYLLLCNEYCGLGHQFMSGRIIVEGPAVQPGSMEMDMHGRSDQDQPSQPGSPAHVMPSGMPRPTATDMNMNHGNDGGHQPVDAARAYNHPYLMSLGALVIVVLGTLAGYLGAPRTRPTAATRRQPGPCR